MIHIGLCYCLSMQRLAGLPGRGYLRTNPVTGRGLDLCQKHTKMHDAGETFNVYFQDEENNR